jgi:hypothetical protein|nr:MAG TPA: hypothetical protein [Bacteriophage sp.]
MDATMYSLRIQSKGKIESLADGFSLSGTPFSVFVRAKENTMETHVLIRCKLICDKEDGDFPVPIGDWTPGSIVSLSPGAIDLEKFEIYWGAGETIKK